MGESWAPRATQASSCCFLIVMRSAAYSLDDGVIEALESPDHRWVVGDSKDPRMETIAARVPKLAAVAASLLDELD